MWKDNIKTDFDRHNAMVFAESDTLINELVYKNHHI
jgi:hypothetical protein